MVSGVISFDGNGAPFELLAVMAVLSLVSCLGTGLFTELTWRNSTLKDLEIAKLLRERDSPRSVAVADESESRAIKRVSDHCNNRNTLSLVIGVLLRGIPYFVIIMVLWPLYQSFHRCLLFGGSFGELSLLVCCSTCSGGICHSCRVFCKALIQKMGATLHLLYKRQR